LVRFSNSPTWGFKGSLRGRTANVSSLTRSRRLDLIPFAAKIAQTDAGRWMLPARLLSSSHIPVRFTTVFGKIEVSAQSDSNRGSFNESVPSLPSTLPGPLR